jgi:vacuolar-type H+-ATPase subunit C/Vma6
MGQKCYEENSTITCLDVFIDKAFFEKLYETYMNLPRAERKRAKPYASMENDSFTLLTLLRGKILNYDSNWLRLTVPQNYFNLQKDKVEAIVSAADYEAALKLVLESPYADFFAKAQSPQETVANAEKAFRKAQAKYAQARIVRAAFTIGLPLSFLTQKEAEMRNLSAISIGVEAGMGADGIQSQLLL